MKFFDASGFCRVVFDAFALMGCYAA